MTSPFDGIELPDISALAQYDGFPDDVTETARPVNVFEKSHYSRKGKEIETTDDEAQTLVYRRVMVLVLMLTIMVMLLRFIRMFRLLVVRIGRFVR